MINTLDNRKDALQILMVDDHQLTCAGYSLILEHAKLKLKIPKLRIHLAYSLKKAYQLLDTMNITFDIVFLDICIEPYTEQNLFSGEDLGRMIVERYPKTRILVITSLTDKIRLKGILTMVKPKGFLLKSEVNENHLIKAIQNILVNQHYYSPTVENILQKQFHDDLVLTREDKKFLYHMSKGIRNKEMVDYLPWSLSKVEKRKRLLHKKLGVENGNTMALVHKAKELGII